MKRWYQVNSLQHEAALVGSESLAFTALDSSVRFIGRRFHRWLELAQFLQEVRAGLFGRMRTNKEKQVGL